MVPNAQGGQPAPTSMSGSSSPMELTEVMQKYEALLLHAQQCQQPGQCSLAHCHTMKNVFSHMTHCQAGRSCQVEHCVMSKQILSHWRKGPGHNCPLCLPLTNTENQGNPQTAEYRRLSIQRCILSLVHACQCRNANCSLPSCQKMKRVVQHTKGCKRKTNDGCPICKQLIALCCYHAKHCQEIKCPVPFCLNIKHKLWQQQLQHRLQQFQMLRRRMDSMQRVGQPAPGGSSGTSGGLPSPGAGNNNGATGPSTPASVGTQPPTPQTPTQSSMPPLPQQQGGGAMGTSPPQQGGAMPPQHHLHHQFPGMGGGGAMMNSPQQQVIPQMQLQLQQQQQQAHPGALPPYSHRPPGASPLYQSLGKPGLGPATPPPLQQQQQQQQPPNPGQGPQQGPPPAAVETALKIQRLAESQRLAQIYTRQGPGGMMLSQPHHQSPQVQLSMAHPGAQAVPGRGMLDSQQPGMMAAMQQGGAQAQQQPPHGQQWGPGGPAMSLQQRPGMMGQMTPQQQQAVAQQQQLPQQQAALQDLLQTLRSPSSPQQQQQILNILRSNPLLMAAFIKQRAAHYQESAARFSPPQQQPPEQARPSGIDPMVPKDADDECSPEQQCPSLV